MVKIAYWFRHALAAVFAIWSPFRTAGRGAPSFYTQGYMREEIDALRRECGD